MAADLCKIVWGAKDIYSFPFLLMISTTFVCENLLRQQLNLVHFTQFKMATKFKMAAIYQNMACRYGQLVLLRVKYLSYLLDMDSKVMLNILQLCNKRITLFKKINVNFTFQNGRQSVLKLARN